METSMNYKIVIAVLLLFFTESITNGDHFANLYRSSETIPCIETYPSWSRDKLTSQEGGSWQIVEGFLEVNCKQYESKYSQFVFEGNMNIPTCCGATRICNQTYCLELGPSSTLYSVQRPRACVSEDRLRNHHAFGDYAAFTYILKTPPTVENVSESHSRQELCNEEVLLPESVRHWNIFANISQVQLFTVSLLATCQVKCDKEKDSGILIQGVGRLPEACEEINICNSSVCTVFSKTSMLYANIRNNSNKIDDLLVPPIECLTETNETILEPDLQSCYNPTYTNSGTTEGLLKFNIPGHRYCAPGWIMKNISDDKPPTNALDTACRDYNIEYNLGVTTDTADKRFLQKLWDMRCPFLPLFVAVFEAKVFYEATALRQYTSILYFNENNHSSFVECSAFHDNISLSYVSEEGKSLEYRWKTIVRKMWDGICLSNSLTQYEHLRPVDSDNDGEPGGQSQKPGTSTDVSGSAGGSRLTKTSVELSSSEEADSTETETHTEQLLTSTTPLFPCNLVISEIATRNTINDNSFIELQRICPDNAKGVRTLLTGFMLIRIVAGEQMFITMSVDLRSEKLNAVMEPSGQGIRKVPNFYHVSGFGLSEADFDLTNAQVVTTDNYQGIHKAGSTANALVLLHIPTEHRIKVEKEMRLRFMNTKFLPALVTEYKENLIQTYIQDIIVYGPPCSMDDCRFFAELLRVKQLVSPAPNTFLPVPEIQKNSKGVIQYRSTNRCTGSKNPMQINDWLIGQPTPKAKNKCPNLNENNLPFSFRGTPLQTTAQRVIVNVYTYFQKAFVDKKLFDFSPSELTRKATTLSTHTLTSVLENFRRQEIKTPQKRKETPYEPVMCQFDSFYYDMIRRIIQRFYEKYEPPLLRNVHQEFLKQVQDDIAIKRQTDPTVRDFSCGLNSFRKVLKRIGFVFGKIGFRDAILQRPDIVKRRGEYLLAMRANEKSDNPLPVVYTDETWVDPHARTGKAWVPRKTSGPHERLLYTYQKHKASRGPRLIVLNAGGINGYVPGVMRVYPVKKQDVRGDYHENVDAQTYTSWFMNLLTILSTIGPHLIVIDNAPYHSETVAPKQRERKGVIYQWLKENLEPEHLATLQPEKKYRKWELWNILTSLKKRKSFYKIDIETEKLGHKIIRLPPYNCDLNPIEYCWKDLKHELRNTNVDQNVKTMQLKAEEYMKQYGTEKWRAHIGHVLRLGEQYWKEDGLYEEMLDKQTDLIIPVGDDDDSDDEFEDEETNDPTIMRSVVHDLDVGHELYE